MKKINLRICVFAMFSCLFSFGLAQSLDSIPIPFTMLKGDIIGDAHGWHRGPAQNQSLPVVYYDTTEEFLYFESEELINGLSVQIVDESGVIIEEQIMTIQPDVYTTIDVSNLSEGLYFIIIYMNGRTYIGEFEPGGI